MIELFSYHLGFWTGDFSRDGLEDVWKQAKAMGEACAVDGSTGDRVKWLWDIFPHGFIDAHFSDHDSRTVPHDFCVNADVLLEVFVEDPVVIQDWEFFDLVYTPDHLVPYSRKPVVVNPTDHHVAFTMSVVGIHPGDGGIMEYELESTSMADIMEGLDDQVIPVLTARHAPEFEAYRAKGERNIWPIFTPFNHGGWTVFSGVMAFDTSAEKSFGGYEDPPDYWVNIDFLGILNTVGTFNDGHVSFPVTKGGDRTPAKSIVDIDGIFPGDKGVTP